MASSNAPKKTSRKKKWIWIFLLALPLLLFVGAGALRHFGEKPPLGTGGDGQPETSAHFFTSPVSRDDILVTISATGTLEPEKVIDVGAQVAGQIISFGKDADEETIDYGSQVEKDMILAQIDDSLYAAGVDETKAQIAANEAAVLRGQATLVRAQALLTRAEQDWNRAQKLGPSEALARSKYDNYKSVYEIARADVAVNKAEIEQIKANLAQSEAALFRAQRNFDYCTIRSPVKGVIIDRRVNIGQTVVSSLNAPSLFLLAKDLRKMEVWVAVNEADIGKIKAGGAVIFTVDAFPGQEFEGEVDKIRLNASMTQNVVSYIVVVTTDNQDGQLLPYLTANVTFELERREGVLTVPKSAISWSPTPKLVAAQFIDSVDIASKEILWVADGEFVRPVQVDIGSSDGAMTEVEGEDLYEGLQVVTGERAGKRQKGKRGNGPDSGETSNPFAPKIPSRPGGSGGPGGGGPSGGPGGGSGPPG